MHFISPDLELYAEQHTSPESPLLSKIHRETYAEVLMPRMLSGHLQGRLLTFFCAMIKPKHILEIGTFTGYATLAMAEGMPDDAHITTIDINEELQDRVQGYFNQSEYKDRIHYKIGAALEVIPTLTENFDLVFIDADKKNNLNYYRLVFDKVNKGGFIIIDNVLWSGKVVEPKTKTDKDLDAIMELNDYIAQDSRVMNILLPIRDGLMLVQKL
jgi:predicted O-methyltransferase YrrM